MPVLQHWAALAGSDEDEENDEIVVGEDNDDNEDFCT